MNFMKRLVALGFAGILLYYVTLFIVWVFGIFAPHYPINQLGAIGVLGIINIIFEIMIKDEVR